MFYYTCFYRHRDNSGKIIGYTLRNEMTSEYMQVTPEQLKDAIYYKRVHIFNLKLTSDGRIIEASNPLPKPVNNSHIDRQNVSCSNVKIVGDTEDLGYDKNMYRRNTLENRVHFDGPFQLNKIIRLFTGRKQGKLLNFNGGYDDYDDDGDGGDD